LRSKSPAARLDRDYLPCYLTPMNAHIASLAEEAERLPPADRIELVERLLSSLDKPDPETDQAWAEESERRLDAYLSGAMPARDAEDVLAKHLKPRGYGFLPRQRMSLTKPSPIITGRLLALVLSLRWKSGTA